MEDLGLHGRSPLCTLRREIHEDGCFRAKELRYLLFSLTLENYLFVAWRASHRAGSFHSLSREGNWLLFPVRAGSLILNLSVRAKG